MFNPFAPLLIIMIPIGLFSAMMIGLNKINSIDKDNDIEFSFKRGRGKTTIGIKIIPVIMVIYLLWVYFSNEMWNF